MKLWTTTKRFIHHCWDSVIGPINPNNEKFNIRTRFKLALISFAILTAVFLISFREAVRSTDIERTELMLNFAQHISYVLGAVKLGILSRSIGRGTGIHQGCRWSPLYSHTN